MDLYLDTEFNGFKGDLISMALVSEEGHQFYEVLTPNEYTDRETSIDPWVLENVIPILFKCVGGPGEVGESEHFAGSKIVSKMTSLKGLQIKLESFLCQFKECHIIADWHEDIAYFCQLLTTGPGQRINTPDLSFEVVRVEAPSKLPHNALEDARGVRDFIVSMR